jgi:hypothetical protein
MAGNVLGHLNNQHTDVRVPRDLLLEELSRIPAASCFPSPVPEPVQPVPGLPFHEAYQCRHCPKLYGTLESLKKHYRGNHVGMKVDKTQDKVTCQRWNQSDGRTYFLVFPKRGKPPVTNQDFLNMVEKTISLNSTSNHVSADLDNRLMSPFLVKMKWVKLIAGLDLEHVKQLLSPPTKQEMGNIEEAARLYFKNCLSLIDKTPDLELQWLNTDDVQGGG